MSENKLPTNSVKTLKFGPPNFLRAFMVATSLLKLDSINTPFDFRFNVKLRILDSDPAFTLRANGVTCTDGHTEYVHVNLKEKALQSEPTKNKRAKATTN